MAQGVVFLPSYYEAIREMPDDLRLAAYEAIILYGLYGTVIDMPNVIKPLFALVRPSIDASLERYRAVRERRSRDMFGGEVDAAT